MFSFFIVILKNIIIYLILYLTVLRSAFFLLFYGQPFS